jgi:hypothetical protein
MALPQKAFTLRRRALRHTNDERDQLMQALAHTRVLISQAYRAFDSTKDDELIESYVFEINALQARYSYLLRRIKELEHAHG